MKLRRRLNFVGIIVVLAAAAVQIAAAATPPVTPRLPAHLWVVALTPDTAASFSRAEAAELRERGINAVVAERAHLSTIQMTNVARGAAAAGFPVLVAYSGASRPASCTKPSSLICVRETSSPPAAAALATKAASPVILRLRSIHEVKALESPRRGRIVVLVPLDPNTFDEPGWRDAAASAGARVALGAIPVGSPAERRAALGLFEAVATGAKLPASAPTPDAPPVPSASPGPAAPATPTGPSAPSRESAPVPIAVPGAFFLSQPPSLSNSAGALFSFGSSDGATLRCSLDGASLALCTSPVSYGGLADGPHTFGMTPIGSTGTAGTTASYGWSVDTVAPATTITGRPSDPNSSSSASFTFSSTEASSAFQCSLDGGAYTACSSPKAYAGIGVGTHTFHVKATDPAGNTEASPAAQAWTVIASLSSTANVVVSTTGNDSTCQRYTSVPASPLACATFDRAFQIAQGGDLVQVNAGTYGGPGPIPINQHSAPIATAVTFQPASAGTVLLASDLDIKASHFHMIGVSSAGAGETRNSLDVCDSGTDCPSELTDVYVQGFAGKSAFVRSSGVTIKGGEFGNFDPCISGNPEDVFRLWSGGGALQPQNDVVDGVVIHDNDDHHTTTACPGTVNAGIHVDCLQTNGGTNITIQNVVMYRCATSNIQAEPFSGASMSNWTVQNNFFGKVLYPGNSVVVGNPTTQDCSTFVLRYNVFESGQPNTTDCTTANAIGYGNVYISSASQTSAHMTQSYSVFAAASTASINSGGNSNNVKCSPSFVAAGSFPPNYRLSSSDTCARGAGDPARFPAADIEGQSRPNTGGASTGAPDAGADEIP